MDNLETPTSGLFSTAKWVPFGSSSPVGTPTYDKLKLAIPVPQTQKNRRSYVPSESPKEHPHKRMKKTAEGSNNKVDYESFTPTRNMLSHREPAKVSATSSSTPSSNHSKSGRLSETSIGSYKSWNGTPITSSVGPTPPESPKKKASKTPLQNIVQLQSAPKIKKSKSLLNMSDQSSSLTMGVKRKSLVPAIEYQPPFGMSANLDLLNSYSANASFFDPDKSVMDFEKHANLALNYEGVGQDGYSGMLAIPENALMQQEGYWQTDVEQSYQNVMMQPPFDQPFIQGLPHRIIRQRSYPTSLEYTPDMTIVPSFTSLPYDSLEHVIMERDLSNLDPLEVVPNEKQKKESKAYKKQPEDEDATLPCPNCDKYFSSKYKLRSHMKSHNPKKHKCDLCVAQFSRAHDLKRHISSIHSVTKLFECRVCHSKFARAVSYSKK